jgi:PadR family transcriptional regulator PadR
VTHSEAGTDESSRQREPTPGQEHAGSTVRRRPGRQLLQSALLLLLAERPRHGYALTNAVAELGLGEMDRPRIYRALAELELHGLVKVWDETSHTGHTRKVYSVTDCGHASLRSAVTNVTHERNALDNFLQRYRRMTPKAASSENVVVADNVKKFLPHMD